VVKETFSVFYKIPRLFRNYSPERAILDHLYFPTQQAAEGEAFRLCSAPLFQAQVSFGCDSIEPVWHLSPHDSGSASVVPLHALPAQ
jgi:hypothetical protein